VGVIYAEPGKELNIETIKIFRPSDVMLISGDGTSYMCEYVDDYKWIINIAVEQSFTVDGGILKYGNKKNLEDTNLSYYFSIITGVNGYIHIRYVEIIYTSKMNSLVYIEGGTVFFEHVKMFNETTHWIYPIIKLQNLASSVIIDLLSLVIVNSYYQSNVFSGAVVFFSSVIYVYPVSLNISSLFFQHNTFIAHPNSGGGAFAFLTYSCYSCLLLFYYFVFFT
jgi:hypothetical protein